MWSVLHLIYCTYCVFAFLTGVRSATEKFLRATSPSSSSSSLHMMMTMMFSRHPPHVVKASRERGKIEMPDVKKISVGKTRNRQDKNASLYLPLILESEEDEDWNLPKGGRMNSLTREESLIFLFRLKTWYNSQPGVVSLESFPPPPKLPLHPHPHTHTHHCISLIRTSLPEKERAI